MRTVILQSHLDMVGEKDTGHKHDFLKDPVKPFREKGWIRADGTTLGADDGIGIAAQMAVLSDKKLDHGPVECLFTVDEESGMTGAKSLDPGFLGGKILLNLDSEDWGELFIGCAGGIDTLGEFRFNLQKPEKDILAFRISVSCLKGGHSGDEIHKSPGNAIKVINRLLLGLMDNYNINLIRFEGGNLRNAIPREAFVEFTIPSDRKPEFKRDYELKASSIYAELKKHEPEMLFQIEEMNIPEKVIQDGMQSGLLTALDRCPHGVINWSPSIEGLVETSTNLASIKFTAPDNALVITSQRSSVESEKMAISRSIADIFAMEGAEIWHTDGYPGWTPDMNSEILKIASGTYRDLFGNEPGVRAIHAGLECGLIREKYPDLDMVSFGPEIRGAHTTLERLDIKTTEKFWKLLVEILKRIPHDG